MKCPICATEFTGRADAKTCGKDACRKKLQRLSKRIPEVKKQTHKITAHVEKEITLPSGMKDTVTYTAIHPNLSPTDKLFDQKRPGYYKFSDTSVEKECMICKKKFKTKLELLKFCSPQCQSEIMIAIAERGLG